MNQEQKIKRIEITAHGYVQGVTFRINTQRIANELGLLGWVKNEPDGTVKIIAEGEKEKIKKLIEWVKKGPRSARVERVESEWQEAGDDLNGFEIRY